MYGDVCSAPKSLDFSYEPSWSSAPQARALCETLLCADAAVRPTPRAVLHHPWLVAAPREDRRIDLSLRYLGRVSSMRDVCLRCLEATLPSEFSLGMRSAFELLDLSLIHI